MSSDILKQLTRIANSLEKIAGGGPEDTTADIPENWSMTQVDMCPICGCAVRYSYDDIKMHMFDNLAVDAFAHYVECPNCKHRMVLSKSTVRILKEMKAEYERENEEEAVE